MVGEKFNYEDVFFRDLTVCVLDTLEDQIKWTNRFTTGDYFVNVPIYYSMTGDERFLLDSFSDDIVSDSRYVELNTDVIPRGHLTMTGFNIKSDEFANPNVWLRMVVENEKEIRKVLTKVRAVPISVTYDLTILLTSEIDSFKCSQCIMNTLWIYRFMYFEFNFMNIDAVMTLPDTNSVEMSREKNLTSDNSIKLKVSFTVDTYYPAFRPDRMSGEGYVRDYGSGMYDYDMNGYVFEGEVSDIFNPTKKKRTSGSNKGVAINETWKGGPWQDTSVFGSTGSFTDTGGGVGGSDPLGTSTNPDNKIVVPKRARWFNEILKSREINRGG